MHAKVYMSNISPLWPFERQTPLLEKAKAAGFTELDIRKDVLDVKERRAHKIESLTERHILLRNSTRKDGGTLIFPTLAGVAWSSDDLFAVLATAADLNMKIWVLDQDLKIPTRGARAQWRKAAEAFVESRKRDQTLERGQAGGNASAERRAERLKAGIEQAKPLWGQDDLTMQKISEKVGVSVSGLVATLGKRLPAQTNYRAELKRKVKREAKRQTRIA
jgi:hypothetical protein